jgi:nucleoside-diphosphate-sugar epimerase
MKIAVTGGTGFIGSRLLDQVYEANLEVRALTRRSMRKRRAVSWIDGSLDDPEALAELVRGTDAVIHMAGVISGRTAVDFDRVNVDGTAGLLSAARAAGARRFVHVSSLAAREPDISLYGASKAKSEELVRNSGLDYAIVRPPAVYGPGDKETLELFRMARLGLMMLPPPGRISMIHVDDLVRLLFALCGDKAPSSLIVEPDDGRPGGLSHRELAKELGTAVGRRNVAISMPKPILRAGAFVDRLVRRDNAKLTADRAAYFAHPDWTADPSRGVPAELWKPNIRTSEGLAQTARWYRDQHWL